MSCTREADDLMANQNVENVLEESVPECEDQVINQDSESTNNTSTRTCNTNVIEQMKEPPDKEVNDGQRSSNFADGEPPMKVQTAQTVENDICNKDCEDECQQTKASSPNKLEQGGDQLLSVGTKEKPDLSQNDCFGKYDEDDLLSENKANKDIEINENVPFGITSTSKCPEQITDENEKDIDKCQVVDIRQTEYLKEDQIETNPIMSILPRGNNSTEHLNDLNKIKNTSVSKSVSQSDEKSNDELEETKRDTDDRRENGKETEFSNGTITDSESSPRNVFDAFPINISPIIESNEIEKNGSIKDKKLEDSGSNLCIESSIEINQSELKLNSNGNIGVESHNLVKNQIECSSASTFNLGEDMIRNEMYDTFEIINENKSRFVSDKQQLSSMQNKDLSHEAEILKKAKQKYQLKELRISLHSDELINDLGELTPGKGQNEKGFQMKMNKSKTKDDNSVSETKSTETLDENETAEGALNDDFSDKEILHGPSKTMDHYLDNDCAKPLKKRCRRGYEESKESFQSDEQTSSANSFESSIEKEPCSNDLENLPCDTALIEDLSSTCNQTNETNKSVNEIPKLRKGRKSGKKSKCKKAAKPFSTDNKQTDESNNEKSSNSVENEPAEMSSVSKPKTVSNAVQLKKYPGRSCKLRNQLPQVIVKPKKVRSPQKSKLVGKNDESILKTSISSSDEKVKKRRKRKVKPWSWGNEKKKYKPKPKIPTPNPEDVDMQESQEVETSSISPDKKRKENEVVSKAAETVNGNVCTMNTEESKRSGEKEEMCAAENKELDSLKTGTTLHLESEQLNGINVCKAKMTKKKGKRVGRPKSKKIDVDSKDYDQVSPLSVPTALVTVSADQDNLETETVLSANIDTDTKNCVENKESKKNISDIDHTHIEHLQNEITSSKQTVPKRKRGRSKGDGKGKGKKRKISENLSVSNASSTEQINEEIDNVQRNPPTENINQEPEVLLNAIENEIHVDHYPHVSPDSGIQSLAGSPAGNESPNSVIINVENSNNSSVVVAKQQHKNDSDGIEPSASGTGLETNYVTDHRTDVESEQSANESQKECVVIENVSDKTNVGCDKSNNLDTIMKEYDKSKDSSEDSLPSNSNDISKDTVSNSPSKKKNRAKFLHLHKASTLLQKGRLPTDEEIEKRLDDKFDYPEKAAEIPPTNPPIDVYSQHMNSFQVTHGSYTEMLETSTNELEKVLNCDLLNTIKEKRKGKKLHSKHKSKRKSNSGKSERSRASIFEKMNDIQNQNDSEVTDKSLCAAIVCTSSSVISNYSPVYHSSSVLTPVTVTLSSVALTDSVSTSMSVTKPISSVLHSINSPTSIENYINESEANIDLVPSINQPSDKDLICDAEIPKNVTPQTEHVISQVNSIPIKRKPGRPPGKKKGIISIKNKVFHKVIKVKKSLTPLSVNKINSVKEKRKPGRPKGSKNKKSLEKEKALLQSLQLKEQNSEIDSQQKAVGRIKGVTSPVRDKHSHSNNFDSFKDQSVEVKKSLSFGCQSKHDSDKPPNFSNKMAWRESSVLGHDKDEKKKRGPGRPRKYPIGTKTTVSKKQSKKESLPDISGNEKGNKSQVMNAVDSVSSEPFLDQCEGESLPSVFKDNDGDFVDESVKQLPKIRKSKLHPMLKKGKRGRKKGFKVKRKSEQSVPNVENTEECEPEENITDLQPARSVSSHDSDTSGAGSSLCSKSFQMQMWMDMDKNRRKNKKQKLKYFRSKHKNIIDPVFISKVDCLINDFTQVSISPPGETFLKVRPWEVPLPSIFKIVRINIKKKKNKLFVFEKAKPLKPKNEQESSSKDKIKLGRKIGDHIMGLNDINDQQHCNLPPKKRHKLFSGLGPNDSAEGNLKPEKRKTGRPRKVRHQSPDQGASFSFGEVHKTKQGLGQDDIEALESFASVAASSQSPNSSFSPDKISSSFSPISPKSRKSDNGLESHSKPVNSNDQTHQTRCDTSDQSQTVSESVNEVDDTQKLPENQSCDKCSELQSTILEESYLSAKVNSPKIVTEHLNRKVKRLKRKYRRSKKLTRRKQKLIKPDVTIEGYDSLDLDSSVRSVCSESEPLPSLYSDKRKLESDSEDDVVIDKHRKLLKRRTSDASQESDTAAVRKQNGPINQKKKYQKAGLYSDAYKDDEKSETKEAVDTYFTFDLPLHFGQHQLRNMINDFQLPYDVWWLNFNDMLPKKGDGKQYRSIRNNIYVDARPACRYEAHACSCKKPLNPSEKGCGEDCINRLVYTECSASLCPCYDQCSNQSIQKHQFAAGLQKFLTKDRGFGVRTTKPIKLGQLIAEYCGEVVSEQEFRRRMTEEYSQDRNHYCLNLDSGTVIDGYRKGNIARFVNHSCEPNCEMQKWNVDGVYHMCLFALRDIEPSEELVYDYNFQSFNHDAQQLCKCGSEECRGIIGGKKQWFNGQVKSSEKLTGKKSKHLKDKRKSKQKGDKMKDKNKKYVSPGYQQGLPHSGGHPIPPYFTYPIKPLMKKERIFARKHSIFLVRNFDRIRGMKDRPDQDTYKGNKEEEDYIKGTHFTKRDVFITQLTALKTSRSMKTRRLTVAEEDTEVSKMARIAGVCKEIYSTIGAAKDEEGSFLATDLYHLPSKKKHPRYYQVIEEPIDLTMIHKKILSGMYQSVELFEKDVIKLFHNVELYCGKKSEMGEKIQVLRSVFSNAKRDRLAQIQDLLGPDTPSSDSQTGTLSDVDVQVATPTTSVSSESDISEISDNKGEWLHGDDDEEEIIRCICGIYKDEGLMIQCDKCYIWQHTDCMRVKGDIGHYLCEQCDPRPVDMEVELVPGFDIDAEPNEDENRYFMTLMRDDMQIRLGACVYVMKENQSRRYSYKKSGGLDKDRMDIFRIERLWKTKKGEKYAFGHMYVRPHETFHEPNRKFFPNEVFRTPLYEMFELDSITGHCCVLDLLTYCKGKPKGYRDEDLYICEHRMDKTLHLFYKISAKQRYPVNTLSYCFEMYDKRLNPRRTYSPHEVPESYKRNWREKSSSSDDTAQEKKQVSDEEEDIPLVKVKMERRKEKRERVNKILDSLSRGKLSPSKKRSDLTYLLTDRPVSSTSSTS